MSNSKNLDLKFSNDFILLLNNVIDTKTDLVMHHIKSINDFYDKGINEIISRGFNIIVDIINDHTNDKSEEDKTTSRTFIKVNMYNVKIETPEMINNNTLKSQKLLPNIAHAYDKTYDGNLYVDVDIDVTIYKEDGSTIEKRYSDTHFFLTRIPIMVKSNVCNLHKVDRETLVRLNEDPTDAGGYFIIKGNEWIINCLESISMNCCRQFKNTGSSAQHKTEICRTDFISKAGDGYENSSHIITKLLNKNQIIFEITNNRLRNVQIPFYVLFRAFGIMSDKAIMESIVYCIDTSNGPYGLDEEIEKMKIVVQQALIGKYKFMDGSKNIYSQTEMLELLSEYIYKNYVKTKTTKTINTRKYNAQAVLAILDNDVLTHIGVTAEDRINKARFLGHMINRLLLAHLNNNNIYETDRDSYTYKRIITAGTAFAKFFKSQFNSFIVQKIQKKFLKAFKEKAFVDINIMKTFQDSFNPSEFNKALITSIITGDKTITVSGQTKANPISSQMLHRKNQLNYISSIRSITTNSFTNAKQSTRANNMRRVQPSMLGYVCTVQTLTDIKVGVIKQLAISASISLASSSEFLKDYLLSDEEIIPLNNELTNNMIYNERLAKVFVNGLWIGCCRNMFDIAKKYRLLRRKQKIHFETTIYTDILFNCLHFYVDNGRLLRPLLIVYSNYDEVKDNENHKGYHQYIKLTEAHLQGFKSKKITLKNLLDEEVIEYIAADEQENMMLAANYEEFMKYEFDPLKMFTHCDIPQAQLGVALLTGPLANHNQIARSVFQGNQIKQACSVPNLNFGYKTYKDQYIHINNEYPLVKTMVTRHFPTMGCNAMMAIAIYDGYNQDDSLIINQSSIDRGMFNTAHFSFIKTEIEKNEEIRRSDKSDTMNIKSYYNYEKLVNGLIPVGAYVEKDDVVIGKISKLNKSDLVNNDLIYSDQSIIYKNMEPAHIWDIVRDKNEDGKEFIKIIYYQYRKSDLGNKYCLSGDHEVLTTNGWKYISETTINDKIAILENGETLKYENPKEMHMFSMNNEDIAIIDTKMISLKCTLNHKIYTKTKKNNKFELIEIHNVLNTKEMWFKKNSLNNNKNIDTFTIPAFIHEKEQYSYCNIDEFTINMNYWLMFFGLYISEGHIDQKYNIRISAHKQRVKDKLNEILPLLEFKYKIYKNEENYYYINNRALSQYLLQFGKGIEKYLPNFVWDLSENQCKILLESLLLGDGYINGNSAEYYTGSQKLANDFHKLTIHCGYSGKISIKHKKDEILTIKNNKTTRKTDQYRISVIKSNTFLYPKISKKHIKIEKYTGYVYCPTVSSGVFMTRKNGKIHWTGNSSRSG